MTMKILDAADEVAKLDPATLAGALALPHADWCNPDHPYDDVIEEIHMDLCFPVRWSSAETVVTTARPIILNGNH